MALRLMTLAEIEAEYKISQRTLMRYMKQNRLQGVKVAGKWYIPEFAVKRLFLGDAAAPLVEIEDVEIVFCHSGTDKKATSENGAEILPEPVQC